MPPKSSVGSNVLNRSPWQVQVSSKPYLDKPFAFNRLRDAEDYLQSFVDQGFKAKRVPREAPFQLRLRRKGARVQFITFDTRQEAEQARLKIVSVFSSTSL